MTWKNEPNFSKRTDISAQGERVPGFDKDYENYIDYLIDDKEAYIKEVSKIGREKREKQMIFDEYVDKLIKTEPGIYSLMVARNNYEFELRRILLNEGKDHATLRSTIWALDQVIAAIKEKEKL